MRLNILSIGLRSGDLAGIENIPHPKLSHALRAALLVCLGSPSCKKSCPCGQLETKAANLSPVTVHGYCLHKTTPWPYAMATNTFTIFPPLPSFFPFVECSKPSLGFLYAIDAAARASLLGFILWAKPTPSK